MIITIQYKNKPARELHLHRALELNDLSEAVNRIDRAIVQCVEIDNSDTRIIETTDLESYQVYSGRNRHLFRGKFKK